MLLGAASGRLVVLALFVGSSRARMALAGVTTDGPAVVGSPDGEWWDLGRA